MSIPDFVKERFEFITTGDESVGYAGRLACMQFHDKPTGQTRYMIVQVIETPAGDSDIYTLAEIFDAEKQEAVFSRIEPDTRGLAGDA